MWLAALISAPAAGPPPAQDTRVAVDVFSERPVVVAPGGSWWIVGRGERLFASRDRGGAWSEVELPPDAGLPDTRLTELCFFDAERALLVGRFPERRRCILVTEDGGENWRFVGTGFVAGGSDACTLGEGSAWLVGAEGEILVSDDFGESWREMPPPRGRARRSMEVRFVTRRRGVVATNYSIHVTMDAGRTWRELPDPLEDRPDEAIGSVSFWGHRVLAVQDSVLHAADVRSPEWSAVRTSRGRVREYALHPEGLAVRDEAGHVAVLDEALDEVWATDEPVEPGWSRYGWGGLSVDGSAVLVFDGRRLVTRVERGAAPVTSRLFLAPGEGEWTILAMDRAADGTLWGLGRWDLVRSRDGGRTWQRVAELPRSFHRLAVVASGEAVLFRSGGAARWDAETECFQELPEFDSVVLRGIERRDGDWLAHGGRYADEDVYRKLVGVSHVVFAGPSFTGVVLGSTDGLAWRTVFEWPRGFVNALHWSAADHVVAFRSGGPVGVGDLVRGADGTLRLTLKEVADLPIDWGARFLFDYERDGLLEGGEFPRSGRRNVRHAFRTEDGGATWTDVSDLHEIDLGLDRWDLGDGGYVRRVEVGYSSFHRPPLPEGAHDELQVRRGGRWETLRRFDAPLVRCTRTSCGGLLVETADGALLRLGPDGSTWKTLRPADG